MDIKMESLVQCPVCTLYLREGMSLSAHLDTHPKDQVIRALCSLAVPPAPPPPPPRLRPPDHPLYFLQQPPRAPFSSHTDNPSSSSFVLNTKFHETTDSLIMTFVQPAPSSSTSSTPQLPPEDLPSQQQTVQHSVFETKPLMQTKPSHQPMFYKQMSHQVNQGNKKYAPPQEGGVMVVMQGEGPHSSLDLIKGDSNTSSGSSKSGVKILSNVKVELPIQHIPDIIDLTATHRTQPQHPDLQEEEAILPDFVDAELCHNYTHTRFRDYTHTHTHTHSPQIEATATTSPHKAGGRTSQGSVVNTFSVIKNIGNPNLYKDTSSQHSDDNKGSDSSLLPDLTCNENPSISPCSDLTNDSSETLYERTSHRSLRHSTTPQPSPIYQPNSPNKHSPDKKHTTKSGDCANSSTSSIVNNYSIDLARIHQGLDNHSTDITRLDGFFKDIERNKRAIEITHVPMEQSRVCASHMEKECKSAEEEEEDTRGCTEGPHKVEEVDKLLDNLTQKSYTEMENMRPVNVIAFGSMLPTSSPTDTHPSTSLVYQDLSKSVCSLTTHKYIMNDNYSDYFTSGSGKASSSCKETITQWDTHLEQKEEFGLNTFIEISQMQQYTTPAASVVEPTSQEEVCTLTTKAVSEECGRKELSEHDTPWPGMYCDVGGSTSYDLLARETWHSDGSDVDMPITPTKDTYNDSEDIPIVVGVKPPERNYRCGSCGKSFNCPKERRVHRSKEHPVEGGPSGDQVVRRTKKRPGSLGPPLLKPMHIKNELLNTEVPSTNKLKEEMSNVGMVEGQQVAVPVSVQFEEDKKPKLEVDNSLVLSGLAANLHLDIKAKKRKREWTCATCKTEFHGQTEYNEHLKEHPLECLTCGKYFYRRSNMQLHIKRHLGIKNYKCEVCEKRFITKQKMLEHYYGHTGNTPVKCGLCNESFRRHSNMVQHRNKHHFLLKKKLKDYVCHCGEVFHTKKKLAWHKEIHEEKPKACPHCSEKFIHTASLSRHMRRAHNTLFTQLNDGNAECAICHQVYLRTSLESHMRTHAGARPYSCHICNKSFTTKWNLKLHRWTHANRSSKPFKCSLCKGAFIRQADYISHMNSHKSVRPYTCNYCGCQFIRKYNCQRHVKEHENDKKFACQVADCGKSFHRSYYLAEHMRVHSGHRPFACNICGKTSSTKSNHNKHVKIHHAREPVTTEG